MRHFRLFLLFIIFIFEAQYTHAVYGSPSDACPFGFRSSNESYINTSVTICQNKGNAAPSSLSPTINVYFVTDLGCKLTTIPKNDCAIDDDDSSDDDGCYPADYPDGVCPTQECTTSTGKTFNLATSKSCSDYSEDPSGESCSGSVDSSGDGQPCIVNDGGSAGGSTDGDTYTGDGGSDGGGSGDGGGGDSDGGGDGSSLSDREQNEQQCSIGHIDLGSGCQPIPDNCGYINGSYQCANPEPPSGCGTIEAPGQLPVTDCFEEQDGCGWFGTGVDAQYGCYDAPDGECEGGYIINGVCNSSDTQTQCPSGYVNNNGTCENYQGCPIGSTMSSLTNSCEPDDCPDGKYRHVGQCIDIPPPPTTDVPGTDGPGTDGPATDVDLSSVNSRLDAINQSVKTADQNNQNSINQNTSAINSMKDSLTQAIQNIPGGGGDSSTGQATNQKLDEIKDEMTSSVPLARSMDIQSSFDFVQIEQDITDSKTMISDSYTAFKDTVKTSFSFTPSGTGSLPCIATFDYGGQQTTICLSDYESQLSKIPPAMVFLSLVAAAFIVLRK